MLGALVAAAAAAEAPIKAFKLSLVEAPAWAAGKSLSQQIEAQACIQAAPWKVSGIGGKQGKQLNGLAL